MHPRKRRSSISRSALKKRRASSSTKKRDSKSRSTTLKRNSTSQMLNSTLTNKKLNRVPSVS